MKILINLPTWLGDALMASSALRLVITHFKNAEFIIYGSVAATSLFEDLENSIIITASKNRYKQALKLRKELGKIDIAISFRSALSAKIILNLLNTKKRYFFDKKAHKNEHQVLRYVKFIENILNIKSDKNELFLPLKFSQNELLTRYFSENDKVLGLNPGAKYGSAKRWESSYFAEVAKAFAKTHKIVIFGIASESDICEQIENELAKSGVKALNLCAKTSVKELAGLISGLDLFITNDSGAMHIAAAFKINCVAIFGPTNFTQTSPWQNQNAKIVHLNLPCMPCHKRVCPLKHHQCMRDLKPELVINAAKNLLGIID